MRPAESTSESRQGGSRRREGRETVPGNGGGNETLRN
jgi:hypothetical protein